MGRRRVRRFIARDSHGRFAKTGSVYRRKASTRKKVAIGAAGAVIVAGAIVGGRELYRSGARTGYDVGKSHGIKSATPVRRNGRFVGKNPKEYKNPYRRGYRAVGKNRMARRSPGIRVRRRASRVASHRIDQNFIAGRRRTAGFHVEKRVRDATRRKTTRRRKRR